MEDYDNWKLQTDPAPRPWDKQEYFLICPSCKKDGLYEDYNNPVDRKCKFCGKKFKG
jgi:uncharacterized CHY-type Zn-finger protein